MDVIFNPVVISVLILIVLSLMKIHVIFALMLAAISAGLLAGLPLGETVSVLVEGMGGQSETALSYLLLGIFASMIAMSGIVRVLLNYLLRVIGKRKYLLIFIFAGIGVLSQTVVPVHIAFIPILVPPLLMLFNKLKIDRRAVASALTYGLKAPYILIPVGYGLIFHGILVTEMQENGLDIGLSDIPAAMAIPVLGMTLGLLTAVFITYRKHREYEDIETVSAESVVTEGLTETREKVNHLITLVAIIAAFVLQLTFDSMIIGALGGITIMLISQVIKISRTDAAVREGVLMMGAIAFIMLIASGYASVLTETDAVNELTTTVAGWFEGAPHAVAAVMLLLVGLVITMGIGTSFGTIPIIAAVFVPLCMALGFSPLATASLIGTAAALGDAGSPASDSTLGPTAGLAADGQHDHIWDTVVPTFLHYNIPLIIFGTIAAVIL
ncbi:Na+/H+ antiporter family protein [Salinicoccus halitifaciens]|uniref:Histidine transporter YuiF (NhaC family) n=1 Tax=Salinicoccus halitifaciens TaxID=1073415 RepID=A0ABV2ECH7_9STAP|nr:Na+/H+ antiporter NhaC family protein [Salinicoccus halitifaciens]MCD2138824.1 sodium:proton antiporter [Salinicoccus halitifaciens]